MNRVYTVSPVGPGIYQTADMSNGMILSRFNIPGVLISGPIVNGDQCTIVTKEHGTQHGYTLRLPSGMIMNRYIM